MLPLTANEALSGISGSISLAAWVFLLVPQLIENYRQGSASGVSILFLAVWMLGDITNLIGSIWADLVPTVIALAIYFCIADTVLILQCLYYNALNARAEKRRASSSTPAATEEATPTSPLLARTRSYSSGGVTADNLGLPGSRRRSSESRRSRGAASQRRDSLSRILEEDTPSHAVAKNVISVVLVILAGAAGWALAWRAGVWKPTPVAGPADPEEKTPVGAAVLGYASAVLYLGARIPQIMKNHRERSCEGLSILFFMLSVLGNLTYGAGILLHSLDRNYVIKNLPWLIGSLGTMAEDAIIFYQFHVYGEKSSAVL
ncbi:PQ-loop-domain-containing protein [Myriangium duriaei CBS 260.36]|uniref:PQ-loop-domain-containing protein n=1 Tax=Myriangium duriaei CBS 260.36 TaxID=1168546 RepID=A0A9P4MJQ4_9PEZI|nr:PQ-loop-domain-containing protein [Myriangium duriaei CBS 260.36]